MYTKMIKNIKIEFKKHRYFENFLDSDAFLSSAKVYRGFNLSYFALFLLDNHVNRMINTINIFVSSFIISPRQNDFSISI